MQALILATAGPFSLLFETCPGALAPVYSYPPISRSDVITSYSIHYTKLYELVRNWESNSASDESRSRVRTILAMMSMVV